MPRALIGTVAPPGAPEVPDMVPGDSFQAFYEAADPGDTINVDAGTYAGLTLEPVTKPSAVPIVFRPVNGTVHLTSTMRLKASNVHFLPDIASGGFLTVDGSIQANTSALPVGFTTIENVVVEYFESLKVFATGNVSNITFRKWITRYPPGEYPSGGGNQIKASSLGAPSDVLFEDFIVDNFLIPPASGDHLDAVHPGAGTGLTFRRGHFLNVQHYAIFFSRISPGTVPTGVLVEDCWAKPPISNSAASFGLGGGYASPSAYVDYTFSECVGKNFQIPSNATDTTEDVLIENCNLLSGANTECAKPGITRMNNAFKTGSTICQAGNGNTIDAGLDLDTRPAHVMDTYL